MTRWLLAIALFCQATPVFAQEPVNKLAEWASYGTALVNPALATIEAFRSAHPKCALGRLALSEAIGNGVALTLKHFVVSPRPCIGCVADGMPSGHTMNSTIGVASQWRVGLFFSLGTAELRTTAHRHTPTQVAAGAALGMLSEWAGYKFIRCEK